MSANLPTIVLHGRNYYFWKGIPFWKFLEANCDIIPDSWLEVNTLFHSLQKSGLAVELSLAVDPTVPGPTVTLPDKRPYSDSGLGEVYACQNPNCKNITDRKGRFCDSCLCKVEQPTHHYLLSQEAKIFVPGRKKHPEKSRDRKAKSKGWR